MATSFQRRGLRFTFTMRTGAFNGPDSPDRVVYEGFRSSVQITAPGGWQNASARIAIKGLSQDVMNSLTNINYTNMELQRNEILIEATGPDGEYNTLYLGTITNAFADYAGAPDVSFNIDSIQELYSATEASPATSWPGPQSVSVIVGELSKRIGLTLDDNGVNKTVTDQVLTGSYVNQIKRLCEIARIDMVIDSQQGRISIMPLGRPRNDGQFTLGPENGLVGWPTPNHLGVDFICLYTPQIYHRRQIKLITSVEKCKGDMFVAGYSINLDCDTPGGAWFMYCTCYRDSFSIKTR